MADAMIGKDVVDWVKAQKDQGVSDGEIAASLQHRGFSQRDAQQAILLLSDVRAKPKAKPKGFHQLVLEKGSLFAVLFYALLVIFALQLVFAIIISIAFTAFLTAVYPIVFGALIFKLIKKSDLYGIISIILLLTPLGLIGLAAMPLLQGFAGMSNTDVYVFISVHTLIIGLISGYMFFKTAANPKKYHTAGVLFSLIISFIFVGATIATKVLSSLAAQVSALAEPGETGGAMLFSMFGPIFNANIGFALAFVFFNLPFFFFAMKSPGWNPKHLLFYLIPVVLFILLSLAFGYMTGKYILAQPM